MHPIGSLVILTVFAKKEKDENVEEGVYQIGADQAISVTCSSPTAATGKRGQPTDFTFLSSPILSASEILL